MHELFTVVSMVSSAIGSGRDKVMRHVAIGDVLGIDNHHHRVTFQKYGDGGWSELHGGVYTPVDDEWFIELLETAVLHGVDGRDG